MCIICHSVPDGNDLTAESVSCLSSSDGEPFEATASCDAMCYGRSQDHVRVSEQDRCDRNVSSCHREGLDEFIM